MRRLPGLLFALSLAAGALLPMTAFARAGASMVCCMMDGHCDCAHSDASFARCTGQDVVQAVAPPPAIRPPAAAALVTPPPAGRLRTCDDFPDALVDSVPPTPPPRIAAA